MSADYLRLGDWNIRCDRCGRKLKGSEARTTWQGLKVCPEHWEPRHPQDFVRAVHEDPTPEFVRDPPDRILAISEQIILEEDVGPWEDIPSILAENGDYLVTEG